MFFFKKKDPPPTLESEIKKIVRYINENRKKLQANGGIKMQPKKKNIFSMYRVLFFGGNLTSYCGFDQCNKCLNKSHIKGN